MTKVKIKRNSSHGSIFQNCSIGLFHVPEDSIEGPSKVATSCDNDAERPSSKRFGRHFNFYLLGKSSCG